MKIKIKAEVFHFGGNTYKRGDVIEVSDNTGALLMQRSGETAIPNPVNVPEFKEEIKAEVKEEIKDKSSIIKRAKDFVEDLLDDGKRNYSNDKTKKSPGRKRK